MIKIINSFIVALIIISYGCNQSASKKVNQEKAAAASESSPITAAMTFDKVSHDFGTIEEGCTVPKYPKNTPIKPGESGEILVSFDSSNKPNMQQKTVTISANTQSGRETLRIKAMVTADPIKQKQRDEIAKERQQQNSN